ncbi:hypothetical protein [Pseudoalteromonas umbrosa]|uniref:hypothetical protein n=1 Tax=Pseudoalteromonas umbrosa TaxID=3048489 RepID=UPI0024C2696A|nr:hypothetical protein [Pseudoalteromonas sp. B95]MDK1286279.1 hypothetical protein [Pseudoalteromonas sp. B95]
MTDKTKKGCSATEWRHMYFIGISKQNPNKIDLSERQVQGLLSMVNVGPAISNGAAIKPEYLINSKGTTPWLAMFALVQAKQPSVLPIIAEGKSRIHIPTQFISNTFNSHNNWPPEVLAKYDMTLEGYNVFVVPFLIHFSANPVNDLSQSLKTPDGNLEIFNVNEFSEKSPEEFLVKLSDIVKFIKKNRPVISQAE